MSHGTNRYLVTQVAIPTGQDREWHDEQHQPRLVRRPRTGEQAQEARQHPGDRHHQLVVVVVPVGAGGVHHVGHEQHDDVRAEPGPDQERPQGGERPAALLDLAEFLNRSKPDLQGQNT